MKKKSILNDNVKTVSDERNVEARKHVDHRVMAIGLEKHIANKVPYMRTRAQKYLCEECKEIFSAYNTTEDEKNKKKYLIDVSRED